MKAAVFYEPEGSLPIEKVLSPNIDPKEVLVNVAARGVCGTNFALSPFYTDF